MVKIEAIPNRERARRIVEGRVGLRSTINRGVRAMTAGPGGLKPSPSHREAEPLQILVFAAHGVRTPWAQPAPNSE